MNIKLLVLAICIASLDFGVSHTETPVTSDANIPRGISQHGQPYTPGKILTMMGIELSDSGIREGLQLDHIGKVHACLNYIEEQKLYDFLPDVKACLEKWEEKELSTDEHYHLFFPSLFAINTEMTNEELDGYMNRIRRQLFDVKKGDPGYRSFPLFSYTALIAAQEHTDVDIYDDLLLLGCTGAIDGLHKSSSVIMTLFSLYRSKIREKDLDTLLEAWKDFPERQAFILRCAREHGIRFEAERIEEPTAVESANE